MQELCLLERPMRVIGSAIIPFPQQGPREALKPMLAVDLRIMYRSQYAQLATHFSRVYSGAFEQQKQLQRAGLKAHECERLVIRASNYVHSMLEYGGAVGLPVHHESIDIDRFQRELEEMRVELQEMTTRNQRSLARID